MIGVRRGERRTRRDVVLAVGDGQARRPRRRAGRGQRARCAGCSASLDEAGRREVRRADDRAADVPRVRLPGVLPAGADRLPGHPAGARCTCGSWPKGGTAVAAAVEAGGNGVRVRDIRLEIGDPDAVLEQARDAAVEEATAKAEQYAEATGQALGDVVSIREVGVASSPPSRSRPATCRLPRRATWPTWTMPIRAGRGRAEGPGRGGLGDRVGAIVRSAAAAIDSAAGARRTGGGPTDPLDVRLNTRAWQPRTT